MNEPTSPEEQKPATNAQELKPQTLSTNRDFDPNIDDFDEGFTPDTLRRIQELEWTNHFINIFDKIQNGELDKTQTAQLLAKKQVAMQRITGRHRDEAQNNLQASETFKQKAYEDPLTGLPNRAWLMEYLTEKTTDAELIGEDLHVVFMDMDRFKLINDTYGHGIGDKIINIMKSATRPGEPIARIGGEEFVLVLNLKDIRDFNKEIPDEQKLSIILGRITDTVKSASQKILAEISNTSDEQSSGVTLSYGISMYKKGDTPESLMKRADLALYEAKNRGRNQAFMTDSATEFKPVELKAPQNNNELSEAA